MKKDFSSLNPVFAMVLDVSMIHLLFSIYEKYNATTKKKIAKNVPKICIKLCAAVIFGCRIRICSI